MWLQRMLLLLLLCARAQELGDAWARHTGGLVLRRWLWVQQRVLLRIRVRRWRCSDVHL
jgi:hypothetical protein